MTPTLATMVRRAGRLCMAAGALGFCMAVVWWYQTFGVAVHAEQCLWGWPVHCLDPMLGVPYTPFAAWGTLALFGLGCGLRIVSLSSRNAA